MQAQVQVPGLRSQVSAGLTVDAGTGTVAMSCHVHSRINPRPPSIELRSRADAMCPVRLAYSTRMYTHMSFLNTSV